MQHSCEDLKRELCQLIPVLMQQHSYLCDEVIRSHVRGAGIYIAKGKPAMRMSYEPGIRKSSLTAYRFHYAQSARGIKG